MHLNCLTVRVYKVVFCWEEAKDARWKRLCISLRGVELRRKVFISAHKLAADWPVQVFSAWLFILRFQPNLCHGI
jgi:hypothetical protein